MADRSVATTDTLDTLRTTFNSTAGDVGDIASLLNASGIIASSTDIVEAVTAMNTEVTAIKNGTAVFETKITFEGATANDFETILLVTDPTADRTITFPDASGTVATTTATETFTNKTLTAPTLTSAVLNTAVSGSAFLDEDNMASDSATKVAGGTGIASTGSGNSVTFAIDSTVATLVGTQTFTNKTLTTPTLTSPVLNTAVSGSAFLDEDGMDSNSATKLASQQSIKAYVDAQITAQDLDFSADSGGALSIDLNSESITFTGGTGITTTGSGNTITFAIDNTVATLAGTETFTNKTLTSPTLNSPTITSATATTLSLTDSSIVFEGATANNFETTLTVTDPTADRTLTLPNSSGTVLTTANAATDGFALAMAAALG